jgi:Flp pilus assembly protein TadD
LSKTGQLSEALDACRRAVELVPNEPDFHVTLSALLLGEDHLDEARDAAQAALKLAPDNVQALNNLGVAEMRLGEIAQATQHLRRALELRPSDSPLHSNLLFAMHLDPTIRTAERFAEHQSWATRHVAPDTPPPAAQFAGHEHPRSGRATGVALPRRVAAVVPWSTKLTTPPSNRSV